jgi:hypothetical protein
MLPLLLPLLLLLHCSMTAHHVSGDWAVTNSYPVTFNIEGGSGDLSRIVGGTVTFTADKAAEFVLFYP